MRKLPDDAPMQKQNMPEFNKTRDDFIATKTEFERVSANWIECKVKWKKLHTKN